MSFLGSLCKCNNNVNLTEAKEQEIRNEIIKESNKEELIRQMRNQIEVNKTKGLLMTPQIAFLKDQINLLTTNLDKQTEKTIKIFGIEKDIAIIRNDLGYVMNNINEIKELIKK